MELWVLLWLLWVLKLDLLLLPILDEDSVETNEVVGLLLKLYFVVM